MYPLSIKVEILIDGDQWNQQVCSLGGYMIRENILVVEIDESKERMSE